MTLCIISAVDVIIVDDRSLVYPTSDPPSGVQSGSTESGYSAAMHQPGAVVSQGTM